MFKDIEKNIFIDNLSYGCLGFLSNKINVGIIGAGKAGYIKAKAFLSRGYNVFVLSKDFTNDFNALKDECNISLIQQRYFKDFINDKHIIVIAINDDLSRKNIIKDCNEKSKIYIDCSDFKNGLALVPFQIETDSLVCGINSKNGNPRVTRKISEKLNEILIEENDFVKFSTIIRNSIKGTDFLKPVMDFLLEDDFRFMFNKGYGNIIINMFYNNLINDI